MLNMMSKNMSIMPCICGGKFKICRRDKLCLEDRVYEVSTFKCNLCERIFSWDLTPKEPDWDGLQ